MTKKDKNEIDNTIVKKLKFDELNDSKNDGKNEIKFNQSFVKR